MKTKKQGREGAPGALLSVFFGFSGLKNGKQAGLIAEEWRRKRRFVQNDKFFSINRGILLT